jgi:hypothetical protein
MERNLGVMQFSNLAHNSKTKPTAGSGGARNTEKGLAQHPLDLPGIKVITEKTKTDAPRWEEQLGQWRHHLTQLFRNFQSGMAEADPKHPVETCRYCDLKTLCRIHENGSFPYDENS